MTAQTHLASDSTLSRNELDDVVVPLRHPWRIVLAVFTGVVLSLGAWSAATNERFEWNVVGQYLFSEQVLSGLWQTLQLTLAAAVIAAVIGCVLALMRLSGERLMVAVSGGYIWAFRATPLLVQLLFWYNLGALYPQIGIGIPGGPQLSLGDANALITPVTAAILGLALHEAAYTAEVFRAGILSVNQGQTEAARALGLTPASTMRWVVLPQALRIIIPPLSNNTIHLLKSTSLVSVIAMTELLYSIQTIYARTFQTIPLLVVAAIWYLLIVSVLSFLQSMLEQRLTGKKKPRRAFWRGVARKAASPSRSGESKKGIRT